jgi:hypothetical protein
MLAFLLAPIPTGEARAGEVELGYTSNRLFDVEVGTPIYMAGEPLWVRVAFDAKVELYSPNGLRMVVKQVEGQDPTKLYQFTEDDPLGIWRLRVVRGERQMVYQVRLVERELKGVTLESLNFSLAGSRLIVSGTVRFDGVKQEGGILGLARYFGPPPREFFFSSGRINGSRVGTEVIFVPAPRIPSILPYYPIITRTVVVIRPFVTNLSLPVDALVWSELKGQLPLLKRVGEGYAQTFFTTLITRTAKHHVTLTPDNNKTVTIPLPVVHRVAPEGEVPIRSGWGNLTTYIQVGDMIYMVESRHVLVHGWMGRQVVGQQEVKPFVDRVRFSFSDQLGKEAIYRLILLVRVNGTDLSWVKVIKPPLAMIEVKSTYTNSTLTGYKLSFDEGVIDSAKVGTTTFALLASQGEALTKTTYTLEIGGFPASPAQLKPQVLRLWPRGEETVWVDAGLVMFHIQDRAGNYLPWGRILIERDGRSQQLVWGPSPGPRSIILPAGEYRYMVEAGRVRAEGVFRVEEAFTSVAVKLPVAQTPTGGQGQDVVARDPLPGLLGLSTILLAEVVAAVLVWRRALRFHKSYTG